MGKLVTRSDLYDLVWSEPMTKLAERFGISSVALAKACVRLSVPVPPRGYWARKAAGNSVARVGLPMRPPGLDAEAVIGGGPYWRYSMAARPSDDDLLGSVAPEPAFDESLDEVCCRVLATIGKVVVSRSLDHPHPAVAKLLKQDDVKRERSRSLTYVPSWDTPRYDSPVQRRRLRLLSALFLALAHGGCRAVTWGSSPLDAPMNEFSVMVGDQSVRLRATVVEVRRRGGKGSNTASDTEHKILLIMNPSEREDVGEKIWEDDTLRLEDQLRDIAVAIVVKGEEQYRTGMLRRYRWRLEARAELVERQKKERDEAERREQEHLAKLERERVERLLGEADALRKASAIRQYVAEARDANARLPVPATEEEMAAWAEWALSVANRIDPILSGAFRRRAN